MSGHWMTAGDLFDGYRSGSYDPDGLASANSCRQVLRELCRVAHDCGIAQISTERLSDRLGLSPSTVKRALKRLRRDGFIAQPVRGTGNRQGIEPRQSVWVIAPLPDRSGRMLPTPERVGPALFAYMQSSRFLRLSESLRRAVVQAWHDMNTGAKLDLEDTEKVPKPADLIADYRARKRRESMRLLSVSQTQLSVSTDPQVTRENESDHPPNGAQTEQAEWPDRSTQLAALERQAEEENA